MRGWSGRGEGEERSLRRWGRAPGGSLSGVWGTAPSKRREKENTSLLSVEGCDRYSYARCIPVSAGVKGGRPLGRKAVLAGLAVAGDTPGASVRP